MRQPSVEPFQVLAFWFAEDMRKCWFNSTPALDAEIRSRFEPVWLAASEGRLDHWAGKAEGALALAIVLDQFPLNMFRNQACAFSTEAKAISVSRQAVATGLDKQLSGEQVAFLYMPLMHSERLADQDLSVQLFETAGLSDNLRFAQHHRELIRRFGRFPHRNVVLGRESSEEEVAYLASKEAFTG